MAPPAESVDKPKEDAKAKAEETAVDPAGGEDHDPEVKEFTAATGQFTTAGRSDWHVD